MVRCRSLNPARPVDEQSRAHPTGRTHPQRIHRECASTSRKAYALELLANTTIIAHPAGRAPMAKWPVTPRLPRSLLHQFFFLGLLEFI